MDAKIDRRTGVLSIHKLHLETADRESFFAALKKPLQQFLQFNKGQQINLNQVLYLGRAITSKELKATRQQLIDN